VRAQIVEPKGCFGIKQGHRQVWMRDAFKNPVTYLTMSDAMLAVGRMRRVLPGVTFNACLYAGELLPAALPLCSCCGTPYKGKPLMLEMHLNTGRYRPVQIMLMRGWVLLPFRPKCGRRKLWEENERKFWQEQGWLCK
jgi:hypothetical protein